MRILAIDYGDARTGLCRSDPMGVLAGEATVLREWDPRRLAERIVAEARAIGAERLVLGLPRNMDGTEGPRAEKARELKALLEELGAPEVVLWDERRTTVEAHAILHAVGRREKRHRENVDAVAASLILEGYLAAINGGV